MGPYSEELQHKRSVLLKSLSENKKLSEDMRLIWKKHYNNLAISEEEYNKRVRKIYAKIQPWNIIK